MRPPRDVRMMMLAEWWSLFSTCSGPGVGAVFYTHDGHVLTSGYNGAPAGLPHCNEQPARFEDANGHCLRCLHAEKNGILSAANSGIRLRGSILATLLRPCVRCTNDIIQVRPLAVVYRDDYDSDHAKDEVAALMKAADISFGRLTVGPTQRSFSRAMEVYANTLKELNRRVV